MILLRVIAGGLTMIAMMSNQKTRTRAGIALQARMHEVGHTQGTLGKLLGYKQAWVSQSLFDDTEETILRFAVKAPEKLEILLRELKFSPQTFQQETGIAISPLGFDGPPSSLEYIPDGAYIRLQGRVSGGNGEPEELDGDLFFVPRHILKKYNITNPDRELGGYMVNGNSMFYASEGVRARGLKNGDLIAVHRFLAPTLETPMVVAWDKREEKMLVKLMDEGEDWVVFRSINSSANPPITRHRDEIHQYGTVIMRITAEP